MESLVLHMHNKWIHGICNHLAIYLVMTKGEAHMRRSITFTPIIQILALSTLGHRKQPK